MRLSRHDKLEKDFKKLFDEIDDYLELKYGVLYPLHPSRAQKGTTSNKEHDGLFNIGASFTPGFGSKYGRGYVIDIRMVTLKNISEADRNKIEKDVFKQIKGKLPVHFPDKNIKIEKDGRSLKLFGYFN